MKFSTRAIHIGQKPDPTTGSIIPPIYQTSTYVLKDPFVPQEYEYTRHGNPNYSHLEETLAALEEGRYCTVFSSGMAAATAFVSTLSSGDRVVALAEVYGGTYRLFKEVFNRFGIDFIIVDERDLQAVEKALLPPTKLLLIETPTNPLMEVIDIAAMAEMAHRHGVLVVVDNTFASPYFQNPLKLGADAVWHSTTKYISGHSDIIGGALVTNNEELKLQYDHARMTLGLNPGPHDAWLASRGVKTLAVRMEQHQKNGLALAKALLKHPKVKRVLHPGLDSHPTHEIAKRQMSGYSGMFSVEFVLSYEETLKMISSYQYFSLAISLGGVESLVNHSASMSHAPLPRDERLKLGITDGLVRFSAGIEDIDDLISDVMRSF